MKDIASTQKTTFATAQTVWCFLNNNYTRNLSSCLAVTFNYRLWTAGYR
ncbi:MULTISPECIES: hypothetical protein [Photorhabdus]|nr:MULTISPECIES: hypothetical protein [Photorhabdus]NDK94835.1 hypothetical protein [Photorhabdus laumondii subsp. laumondii]